ncbi:hypothetical protein RS030_81324 [Cryptosporidium xiaoi]|uniref:ADF-H domain-containing protein n=1 Tax=Cryptosporidium xiaoi TaxID=659607 RepID=A0AAV9XTK7_9CRYT
MGYLLLRCENLKAIVLIKIETCENGDTICFHKNKIIINLEDIPLSIEVQDLFGDQLLSFTQMFPDTKQKHKHFLIWYTGISSANLYHPILVSSSMCSTLETQGIHVQRSRANHQSNLLTNIDDILSDDIRKSEKN